MRFKNTKISGVYEITPEIKKDHRGYFTRVFDIEHQKLTLFDIVNVNISYTMKKGTIRGIHYQRYPHRERKVVMCLEGSIFDVAVDLNPKSPTYLKYHSCVLSSEQRNMLHIPKHCAHGFQALTDNAVVQYLVDEPYYQEAEGGILWNDKHVGIDWPLPLTDISEKDSKHPELKE